MSYKLSLLAISLPVVLFSQKVVNALEADLFTTARGLGENETTAASGPVFSDASVETAYFVTVDPFPDTAFGPIGGSARAFSKIDVSNLGTKGDVGVATQFSLDTNTSDGAFNGLFLDGRASAQSTGTVTFSGPQPTISELLFSPELNGSILTQILGKGPGSVSRVQTALDIRVQIRNSRFSGRIFNNLSRQVDGDGENFEDTLTQTTSGLLQDYTGGFLSIPISLNNVPVGVPVEVSFWIQATGSVSYAKSVQGDAFSAQVVSDIQFDNTFGFAQGEIFSLPEGFTANSDDFGIVGNIRESTASPTTPEPTAIFGSLLLLGLILSGKKQLY